MLLYAVRSKHLSALATIALALCVGGGVSNLVDRLRSSGAVVDFINVGVGGVRTGIFNFADMAIMAGGFLLVISLARKPARA
jgi:signal peptidase II